MGVVGYGIYESGELVDSQAELSRTLINLRCGTSYMLGVDAYDRAGNRSERASTVVLTERCGNGNGPAKVKLPWLPDMTPRGHARGPGAHRGGWSILSQLSITIRDRLSRLVAVSETAAEGDSQGAPAADESARAASHDVFSSRADTGVQRVPSDAGSTQSRASILTTLADRFAAWGRAMADSGLFWRREAMRQYALDHGARIARVI